MKPTHIIPHEANARVYAHGASITSVGCTVVEYASGILRHTKDADLTPYDPAAGLKPNDIVYVASGGGVSPVFFVSDNGGGSINYAYCLPASPLWATKNWSLEP